VRCGSSLSLQMNPNITAAQVLAATAAKPVRISVGMLNRTPGSYINAYTSKGTVYVAVRGRALVAGPFAVPRAKTVLRAGTAVRQPGVPGQTMTLKSDISQTSAFNALSFNLVGFISGPGLTQQVKVKVGTPRRRK